MIRRPPRSTQSRSSAASDVYKRQDNKDYPTYVANRNEVEIIGRVVGRFGSVE